MDTARADALAARDHLRMQGWIAPRNESFRHLPPPGADSWLEGPPGNAEPACDAPPLAGAGWTLHPVGSAPQGGADVFDGAVRFVHGDLEHEFVERDETGGLAF